MRRRTTSIPEDEEAEILYVALIQLLAVDMELFLERNNLQAGEALLLQGSGIEDSVLPKEETIPEGYSAVRSVKSNGFKVDNAETRP